MIDYGEGEVIKTVGREERQWGEDDDEEKRDRRLHWRLSERKNCAGRERMMK